MTTATFPYICLEMDPLVGSKTREINQALKVGTKQSQSHAAAEALSLAIESIVEGVVQSLFQDLSSAYPDNKLYRVALKVSKEIHGKILTYLEWLTKFLSNERLGVVTSWYLSLFQAVNNQATAREFLVVQLKPELAGKARRTIDDLRSGKSKDLDAGVEMLIEIVDELLEPFVYEPKRLMKFNLVVSKTLDGIIYMIKSLSYRELRTFAKHLPPDHLPIILTHLEKNFRDSSHPV
ncbi:MAG: hypothetical protein QE278_06830 [Limnobacter sp.]|nr:hypothetical protein [Limnobacter sp.]